MPSHAAAFCCCFFPFYAHTHTHTIQDIMMFLQNLPTSNWDNSDIELLLAEAYKLKFMFADAPGHLTVQRTS